MNFIWFRVKMAVMLVKPLEYKIYKHAQNKCLFCKQEGEDATQFASRVKSAIALKGGLLDLEWWGSSTPHCPSQPFSTGTVSVNCPPHSPCRDGGLKRQKVKDSYKEEQQKMYSSIIVGQNGCSSTPAHDSSTEDTGGTGPDSWWPFVSTTLAQQRLNWLTPAGVTGCCIDSVQSWKSYVLAFHFFKRVGRQRWNHLKSVCVLVFVCARPKVSVWVCRNVIRPARGSVWQHSCLSSPLERLLTINIIQSAPPLFERFLPPPPFFFSNFF